MVAEYNPLQNEANDFNPLLPQDDQQPLLASSNTTTISPSRTSVSTFIEPTTIYVHDYEQQYATATPFSCIINLANTILGTGMLAMVKSQHLQNKKGERNLTLIH